MPCLTSPSKKCKQTWTQMVGANYLHGMHLIASNTMHIYTYFGSCVFNHALNAARFFFCSQSTARYWWTSFVMHWTLQFSPSGVLFCTEHYRWSMHAGWTRLLLIAPWRRLQSRTSLQTSFLCCVLCNLSGKLNHPPFIVKWVQLSNLVCCTQHATPGTDPWVYTSWSWCKCL